MSERKVDPDMAIWMRRAGITVEAVARYFGSSNMAVQRATRGHKPRYNVDAYMNIEATILTPTRKRIPDAIRQEYRKVSKIIGAEQARTAFPELVKAFQERREKLP
ncbi:MAG TPA: hypothetical protein VEZ16_00220 [Microvirga sp.]|nr:hypothetical protein [Microvirga sp.]